MSKYDADDYAGLPAADPSKSVDEPRSMPALGMCCICLEEKPTVLNVLMLDLRSPKPGDGCWGCMQCGLPMAGAVAVLCDRCLDEHRKGRAIEMACIGFPKDNLRVALDTLSEPFQHNMAMHPGEA